jgi:hypothetical protein
LPYGALPFVQFSGEELQDVAFVEVQYKVTLLPLVIVEEDAVTRVVGFCATIFTEQFAVCDPLVTVTVFVPAVLQLGQIC